MKTNKTYIAIPAYNEGKKITEVIDSLKKENYNNIVIVDDGSIDNTSQEALKTGATVIKHTNNRGQGASLKTAIDYSLKQGADIIVTFDADGQHDPKQIKDLTKPVESGEVDVTLGSRFIGKAENIPFIRKMFLKGGALIIRLFYGIKLTDSHNGFRALSKRAAERIEIKSDRMEHASEILEQIKKKRLTYKEIPVTIIYTEYSMNKGQSTLNAFNILFKMIKNKLLR